MLTGNKGEWSEFYVLLKLLAEGELHSADENLNRIEEKYFPVLGIKRCEEKNKIIDYDIPDEDPCIYIYLNDDLVGEVKRDHLKGQSRILYDKIKDGKDGAFAIPEMDEVMQELLCSKIKAPNADKSDISVIIHDVQTGYELESGFSIKSELGSAPTLLNASKATNFVYRVTDIDDNEMNHINSISGQEKIKRRIKAVIDKGNIEYSHLNSTVFRENLMLIDSNLDKLIGEALLVHFRDGDNDCKTVIDTMEVENPLSYPRQGYYEYKFKKFLCAIALGMVPSKEWDGHDEANGGYIVVTKQGEVLAYHIYNRDAFETYLLTNTKFEHASTSRHDYASIYKKDDEKYINLNLQIRFK